MAPGLGILLTQEGQFTGPFETPASVIQLTSAELDIPGADLWYGEDGKIKEFSCHASSSVMLAQLGVHPDFASAVEALAAQR